MADDSEKKEDNLAGLLDPPGPKPRPWAHILVGLGGAISLALAAGLLVRYYVATRPLDLVPTTQALGAHIASVLKANLVPEEAIAATAPAHRQEAMCDWYHYTYDVQVPADMSASGLRKLLVAGMTERQARVSSEDPLEFSMGPYPFAIVHFHGGKPEPAAEKQAEPPSHALDSAEESVETPQRQELRIASLAMAEKVAAALASLGAPAEAVRSDEPAEDESAGAVWMRTRISVTGWSPESPDALRGALEAAVAGEGGVVTADAEGRLAVLLDGNPVVELELGPSNAPQAAGDEELSPDAMTLATQVEIGLTDAGIPNEAILALPPLTRDDGGATWPQAHFQIKGGTGIAPESVLQAVMSRVTVAGVEGGVDASAGPPELHFKLRGRLAVIVELQPPMPALDVPEDALPADEMLPPETADDAPVVDGPVQPVDEQPATPRVALIIDDGGYPNGTADIILAADPKLTLAILPYTPLGKEIAERGAALGFEIMLHMPMQPMDTSIQFEGQLNTGMSAEEIARLTEAALATVPGVEGINNHTGSKFTSDPESISRFVAAIKDKPYYFIDSVTTAKSKAYDTAKGAGIRAARRNVFLDDKDDPAYIRKQFALLRNIAKKSGSAIGIGHFRPATAALLQSELDKIKADGIQLVHASELVQ